MPCCSLSQRRWWKTWRDIWGVPARKKRVNQINRKFKHTLPHQSAWDSKQQCTTGGSVCCPERGRERERVWEWERVCEREREWEREWKREYLSIENKRKRKNNLFEELIESALQTHKGTSDMWVHGETKGQWLPSPVFTTTVITTTTATTYNLVSHQLSDLLLPWL